MSNEIEKVQIQQVGLAVGEWPSEVWEVVKQQVCPKGITNPEFVVFAAQCKARGLNPLAGEAFCVPRRTNVGDRANPKWVTNHVFQPSAEGVQARAARFPDFAKVDSAAVYEKDPVSKVDTGNGKVEHVFDPTKPRGRFIGSWGRVVKKDGTAVVAWLDAGDRTGTGQFWDKSMARMHEKCARVAALRQAYPVAFAGTYVSEEMSPDEEPQSRAQDVLAKLDGPPAPEAAALPPPPPTVEFGTWKDTPIASLSLEEAEAAASFALEKLRDAKPGAKWIPKLEAQLDLVQQHRDFLAATGAPSEPKGDVVEGEFKDAEPGSRE